MSEELVWPVIVILTLLVIILTFAVLRLRLELWANRRVIAVLEQSERRTPPGGKSPVQMVVILLMIGALLVDTAYLLGLFR